MHVYFQGADVCTTIKIETEIINNLQHAFRKFTSVEGHKQWSQFGLAVAAAGDLNADGFNGTSFK